MVPGGKFKSNLNKCVWKGIVFSLLSLDKVELVLWFRCDFVFEQYSSVNTLGLQETIAQIKSRLENVPKEGVSKQSWTSNVAHIASSNFQPKSWCFWFQCDYDAVVMDLKVLMNKVYRKISQYFEGNNNVSSTLVRQTVAIVLKVKYFLRLCGKLAYWAWAGFVNLFYLLVCFRLK